MSRRPSYTPDDEDDDLRRGSASGGGVPAWVWVVGGGGVLAVLLFVGLGFAMFTSRRAAVREEAHRADVMQDEIAPMGAARADRAMRRVPPAAAELTELADIAAAYRADTAAADERFKGRRVRVEIEVRKSGEGWVGAVATIGRGVPRDRTPNVYFMVPGVQVADGTQVVVEGTCAGLTPDPLTGSRLTFTDCRLVEE